MPPGGSCLERAARSLTRSDGGVLRGPEESAPAPRLPPVALTGRSSPSPPSSARQDRGAPAAFQKYRGDPTGGGVRPPMPPRAPMGTYGHAGGRAAAVYMCTRIHRLQAALVFGDFFSGWILVCFGVSEAKHRVLTQQGGSCRFLLLCGPAQRDTG